MLGLRLGLGLGFGRGLYQKPSGAPDQAGNTGRAIDLCFRHRLFDGLRDIADSLSASAERADPALLQRCADFFRTQAPKL